MFQNNSLSYRVQKEYGYKFFLIVIVFFLASTGFPSFRFLSQYNFLLFPFIFYVIKKKDRNIPKALLVILPPLAILSSIHFTLGHLTLIGSMALLLTIMVALFSAIMMGRSFLYVFVTVMKFFAVTSLLVWVSVVMIPGLHATLSDFGSRLPQMMSDDWLEHSSNEGVSLYLYYLPTKTSTDYTSFIRNNGPFYEPGLFASYLNIALVFSICLTKKLLVKSNIPLILAILSTCSSAGYISFMLIVAFSIFMQKKNSYKIITVLVTVLLWQPVMSLDFMSDKISSNYDKAFTSSASRFGAIIYHWEKVQESPIIGYAGGSMPMTDFDRLIDSFDRLISPNGLSYVFVFWGIPFALFFYFLLYDGIKKLLDIHNNWLLLSWYVVILSTAFSQTITTSLFFITLAAFSFTLKDTSNENCSY